MAIIFTFHKNRASIIRVKKINERMVSEPIREITNLASLGEYLADEKSLDKIIGSLIDEETVYEKCYVNLTFGTGIQYKTFKIAMFALDVGARKVSYDDAYDDLMDRCLEHLPDGALKLHEKYSPNIMSWHESDGDVSVSCAFMPVDYIDNIKNVFANNGLSLFGIGSQASGINNMIISENKQLILETESEFQVYNNFGMLIWPKPEVSLLDREEIVELISEETAELYPIDTEAMNLFVENITNHLRLSVECSVENIMDEIAAIGVTIQRGGDSKPLEGGMNNSVKDFIRKLFKKVGADSSIV